MVKGDGTYLSIAAASVLAKTYRDDYMYQIGEEYPAYNWKRTRDTPPVTIVRPLSNWVPAPYHRMTFTLLDPQLKFNF